MLDAMTYKIPNPIAFVKRGYDQIAATYHVQRNLGDNRDLLEEFTRLVAPRGCVLDIGCGTGVPVMRFLVELECTVTGIDISGEMLALARTKIGTGK
jgi:ubiquinone/menaquinone biosynthesis C-methylase UbiE